MISGMNSWINDRTQDHNQNFKVGARSSFAVGDSDSDNESTSSDGKPPYYEQRLSNSRNNNLDIPKSCKNGDKTGESLKQMLIPMFQKIKIHWSADPKPRQQKQHNPILPSFPQEASLTQSEPHRIQLYQQQPCNSELLQPSPQNSE